MAVGPLHATLVAGAVTPLTLDLADPRAENLSFGTQPAAQVRVTNVSGTAAVYFTVDGSTPTVGGQGCYVLPAAMCSLRVADKTPGPTSSVNLISAGTPTVSVWEAT